MKIGKWLLSLGPWMTCLNLSRGPDKPGLVQGFFLVHTKLNIPQATRPPRGGS